MIYSIHNCVYDYVRAPASCLLSHNGHFPWLNWGWFFDTLEIYALADALAVVNLNSSSCVDQCYISRRLGEVRQAHSSSDQQSEYQPAADADEQARRQLPQNLPTCRGECVCVYMGNIHHQKRVIELSAMLTIIYASDNVFQKGTVILCSCNIA